MIGGVDGKIIFAQSVGEICLKLYGDVGLEDWRSRIWCEGHTRFYRRLHREFEGVRNRLIVDRYCDWDISSVGICGSVEGVCEADKLCAERIFWRALSLKCVTKFDLNRACSEFPWEVGSCDGNIVGTNQVESENRVC